MCTDSYAEGHEQGYAQGRSDAQMKRCVPHHPRMECGPETPERLEFIQGWRDGYPQGYQEVTGCLLDEDQIPPAPGGMKGGV